MPKRAKTTEGMSDAEGIGLGLDLVLALIGGCFLAAERSDVGSIDGEPLIWATLGGTAVFCLLRVMRRAWWRLVDSVPRSALNWLGADIIGKAAAGCFALWLAFAVVGALSWTAWKLFVPRQHAAPYPYGWRFVDSEK